ncbi:MAG: ketoacyl-ACP synthase III [Bacteroidales bacterium]|nr:ketoacyl-ACP synthase III [Bacteroidales bacterium]MBN2818384.1 ketoacyl-ACP synthase III [Bacteroidales bacterium]
MTKTYSVIKGTGSYIPGRVVKNEEYISSMFYDKDGQIINSSTEHIVNKFVEITDIHERRHVEEENSTSDMAYFAALDSINKADIDPETLDYIIVAHNFGDVKNGSLQTDVLPSLASRVKKLIGIENPKTVAYDTIFGCPGWIQGIIQADYYIRSGDAKRVLVVGADVLSRLSDPHDRDSMIYADGAGAVVLEGVESDTPVGILAHTARTDANGHTFNLFMGKSYNSELEDENVYIKMYGHKIYNYALTTVPAAIKEGLEKAGLGIDDVKKVLIHQANAKMDEAILTRLFRLYGKKEVDMDIMPMTISKLGNSSVATVPTMLDMIVSGKMEGHSLNAGDTAVMTSVGAGMNINAVIYKFPE